MDRIINGKSYTQRDLSGISLSEAMRLVDLSIRFLSALLRLQRRNYRHQDFAIAQKALAAFFKAFVPDMKEEAFRIAGSTPEGAAEIQRAMVQLLPEVWAMIQRIPELWAYHGRRAAEEGITAQEMTAFFRRCGLLV